MYLLYNKTFKCADDALEYFAARRMGKTTEFKGAETPSQLRFVKYFDLLLSKYNGILPEETELKLSRIEIVYPLGMYLQFVGRFN